MTPIFSTIVTSRRLAIGTTIVAVVSAVFLVFNPVALPAPAHAPVKADCNCPLVSANGAQVDAQAD